ncbi:DUF502 domain-containing protein [Roseiconus nitratireducens]|uniref:DUF502 domain-containing protein n=1 Tax=Roseiconus nitratireducens TaxID=2605748 RepID=UPI001F3C8D6C|nr:DUF502 domain-containing protein [Roseiconus nitratireducens]
MNDVKRPRNASRFAHFRSFVFRGLGVVLPPLLTILVLIWAWNTIESYVLRPVESFARMGLVWYAESQDGTLTQVPASAVPNDDGSFQYGSYRYVPDPTGRRYLPEFVVQTVEENANYFDEDAPKLVSAKAYWNRYIQLEWMPRRLVVPVFLIVFLTILYFLGRLFTFGLGRWFFHNFDSAILRIPIVNKVYGSVKQVTDFAFSEREIEFNNVVAIQYPSKGIWSIGFVTGNGIGQIADATGEPMLSVLMPTSPMPMTGFTVTVKKSEAIDVDMTIDEAIQFVVSCGVVVPPSQRADRAGIPGQDRKAKVRDGAIVLPGSAAASSPNDPSAV